MAESAECVVLVSDGHASGIRRWKAEHGGAGPEFLPVPEPRWLQALLPIPRRGQITWFLAYLLWLRQADGGARRLCAERAFDVVHHVTYSVYWLPTPAVRLGVPCVWGPVGGAVRTPLRLWPLLGWRGVLGELLDFIAVRAFALLPSTRRTWGRATHRIVQNEATLARLPPGFRSGTCVLNHAILTDVPEPRPAQSTSGFLFIAALEPRKGARLALRALACTPPDVRLTVVGDGPDRAKLERLARRLGIADRVEFRGAVRREEVFVLLAGAAGAVFTGLREEGGLALAEAMLTGVPVVVLANGGARTIAAAALDPSRVALIEPEGVAQTARRIGEAMTRFARRLPARTGPLLDQAPARRLLHDILAAGMARSPGVGPAGAAGRR